MPNQIDSTGLTVKSFDEILGALIAGFQATYGADINIDQSSPDGQALNILTQAILDNLELLSVVYASFSPEGAFGVTLDQRLAINGIARQGGTFTVQPVDITVDRALSLTGMDALVADPAAVVFTVADGAGNKFQLITTHVFGGGGTATLAFQAVNIGKVQTTPNTITNQSTVVLGVTLVNNPAVATTVGQDEETDAQMRARHARSFSLAATGPADAVQAAILNAANVTDALVVENDTGGIVNLVPAHGIWCIVEAGADADIGQAIYSKKAPGCAMKGGVSVTVPRPAGNNFVALFDRPVYQDLWLEFTIVPRNAGVTFDPVALAASLAAALTYKLGQSASIGDLVSAMQVISPQGVLKLMGVSPDNITFSDILAPTDYQHKFVVDPARINILT